MFRVFLVSIGLLIFVNSNAFDYGDYSQEVSKYDYVNILNNIEDFKFYNRFSFLRVDEIVFISLLNSANSKDDDFNIYEYIIAKSTINSFNAGKIAISLNQGKVPNEYFNKEFLITIQHLSDIFLSGNLYYKINDNISVNFHTDALYRMTEMLYGYYNYSDGIKVVGTVKIKF